MAKLTFLLPWQIYLLFPIIFLFNLHGNFNFCHSWQTYFYAAWQVLILFFHGKNTQKTRQLLLNNRLCIFCFALRPIYIVKIAYKFLIHIFLPSWYRCKLSCFFFLFVPLHKKHFLAIMVQMQKLFINFMAIFGLKPLGFFQQYLVFHFLSIITFFWTFSVMASSYASTLHICHVFDQ